MENYAHTHTHKTEAHTGMEQKKEANMVAVLHFALTSESVKIVPVSPHSITFWLVSAFFQPVAVVVVFLFLFLFGFIFFCYDGVK